MDVESRLHEGKIGDFDRDPLFPQDLLDLVYILAGLGKTRRKPLFDPSLGPDSTFVLTPSQLGKNLFLLFVNPLAGCVFT
jgi:hypothetical protein